VARFPDSLVSRARKLVAVLREPVYRRGLLHGVAASVEHDSIPFRADFRTVLDAGANRGQFALFAAHRFPRAELLCFEPLDGPRDILRRAIGPTPRLTVFGVALGSRSESAEFNVSAADDSSSLLPIGHRQSSVFPGTELLETITVRVCRLDELVRPEDLKHPVLLKIDVQGAELGVLEGSGAVLDAVDAVLVEASFVELYCGQPLVDEIWGFMRHNGFTCRGIWSMTFGPRRACLQGDFLFARQGFDPLAD
jgi:FkbM family methyltransferase